MSSKVPKWGPNGTPLWRPKRSQYHNKFKKWKNDVQGRPGVQKASKRHPKDVQKASKCFQIGSQWNQNYKTPMQRTAKNHAPYQSFPTERNHKISTVAGCATHWRVHRRTGIIHKKHRSNPNAKTCKEPCTPSELTKRRVTSRCGGVASAFSIN